MSNLTQNDCYTRQQWQNIRYELGFNDPRIVKLVKSHGIITGRTSPASQKETEMTFTLDNTKRATHVAMCLAGSTGHQFYKNIADPSFELLSELTSFSWEVIYNSPSYELIELSRPHNETKEHWTTNGATQYAQPVKKIPVHWLKAKGIELAFGDMFANEGEMLPLYLIAFADRPNTGVQPVADNVVVDVTYSDASTHIRLAQDTNWTAPPSHLVCYRPNFDALHEIYEKETTMKKPIHDPDQYLAKECPTESLTLGVLPMAEFPHHKLEATPKPECYAKADDKPVFTQAMADAKVPPQLGSEFSLDSYFGEKTTFLVIGVKTNGSLVFEVLDGKKAGDLDAATPGSDFKPIDTRSDEEKAIDAMFVEMETNMQLRGANNDHLVNDDTQVGAEFVVEYMEANGFKWVGK